MYLLRKPEGRVRQMETDVPYYTRDGSEYRERMYHNSEYPKIIISETDGEAMEDVIAVNLSSLAGTPIKALRIQNTSIEEIDLSPLSTCISLEKLDLEDNLLHSIDLSPLSNCPNLTIIKLGRNPLEEIDLNPLRNLEKLKELSLTSPEEDGLKIIREHLEEAQAKRISTQIDTFFGEVDVSPLFDCPRLERFDFNEQAKLVAHNEISKREHIPNCMRFEMSKIEFY